MGIKKLLKKIKQTNSKRFTKNKDKHKELTELINQLPNEYSNKELTDLDNITISLKTRNYRTKQTDEELQELINKLDNIRTPYRGTQETTLYDIITNKKTQYKKRFKKITEQLEKPNTHDDIILTLHHLQNNNYIRKKEQTNNEFKKTKQELETTLENKLKEKKEELTYQREEQPYNFWKRHFEKQYRIATKATLAATAAAMILAATPINLYELIK